MGKVINGNGISPEGGLMEALKVRLRSLVETRKDLVVYINGTPEISRPLALEILGAARNMILAVNGKWEEFLTPVAVGNDYAVISLKIRISIGDSVIEVAEVGECYAAEGKRDGTYARTAYTRAIKRCLENLVGEDFINQIIVPLAFEQATENQKVYLRALIDRGRVSQELVDRLKERGRIRRDFDLDNTETWDKKSVSAIIDAVRGERR